MGKLTGGINGPLSGRVGTIIGSSWKGIPYVKGPYKKRTTKVSKKETANRDKFAGAQFWLKPLLDFVRVGFNGYSQLSEGFVAAKSYLLRNAFEGAAPGIHINPSLVQVSFGNLPLPDDIAVGLINNDHIQFTWDTKTVDGASPSDQVMLLAYDIEMKDAYFTITGQFRSVGTDTLQIPSQTGRNYHLYFALVAADRSRQSHSVYLGQISN